MLPTLFRRLLILPVVLWVASLLIFLLPHLTGIDPTLSIIRARIGERTVDPAAVERLRSEFGLDRSLVVQYARWVGDVVRGDLGFSYVSRTPVATVIGRGLGVTALLAFGAMTLAFVLAVPLGVIAAHCPGSRIDTVITVACQSAMALPHYVIAPTLILVFALWLGWLPSSGWRGPSFAVLPILALLPSPLAYLTQATRTAMIDVLSADYMRTARAKGVSGLLLLGRHALRNALIPVVTLFAIWVAGLLGGSVIIEVIFAIPGLGRILYDAVLAGDIPLLQAGLLLLVMLAIAINTLADVIYLFLNPTIRLNKW